MAEGLKLPELLSVLPLVDKVLFPGLVIRLHVRKLNSKKQDTALDSDVLDPTDSKENIFIDPNIISNLLKDLESGNKQYLICLPISSSEFSSAAKQDGDIWDLVPQFSNRYPLKDRVGCIARVISMRKSPVFVGGMFIVLEGISRGRILDLQYNTGNLPKANIQNLLEPELSAMSQNEKTLYAALRSTSADLVNLLKDLNLPPQMISQMKQLMEQTTPGSLADLIASLMEAEFDFKVAVLEAIDCETRLNKANDMLKAQLKVLKLAKQSQKLDVRNRRFRPQMKSGSNNLPQDDEDEDDLSELTKKLEALTLPEDINKIVQRELRRLKRLQPVMADYQVIRNYLEWISELPWSTASPDSLDVEKARNQLAEDHFGLENVKKRILEYLAVCSLRKDVKAPILCLVGPPGVGKTSLGKSIANALGRKFYRISLGGVRDEAEIRGHRRTYVGAMPGLLIQGLRKCGTNNPVFLLDEVDKVGTNSHHGDPSAALLEVLDPEQNNSFSDHYINAPVDLSKVLFIATANRLDTIPPPLLDRMEVVELSGYTLYQKQHIASRHLIPKHIKSHGLTTDSLKITDDALCDIILKYTSEAGVRSLDREIASVCRFKAVALSESKKESNENSHNTLVDVSDVETILGAPKFRDEIADRNLVPGIAIGLVYTGSGSGKIMFLEAGKMPGNGNLVLTGKLGEVLKESAQLALSWVKGHSYQMGLTSSRRDKLVDQLDVHLHLPEGATPKDGPSAGIALVAALVSLFTHTPLPSGTAMTGEITLRGQVLPVGGIREKVIAAHRSGIRTLLIPALNKPQINPIDLPNQVMEDIQFHYIENLPQALNILFKSMFDFTSESPKFGLVPNL